jgi:hypothetical protein
MSANNELASVELSLIACAAGLNFNDVGDRIRFRSRVMDAFRLSEAETLVGYARELYGYDGFFARQMPTRMHALLGLANAYVAHIAKGTSR